MIYIGDRVTLKAPWGDVEVTEVGRVWVGFVYTAMSWAEEHGDAPMRIKRKHWAKAVRDEA